MIGAIIFARSTSTRLPSKVLIEIEGKSILEHIVTRIKNSKYLENIIVATTTNPEDDKIEKLCKKLKLEVFRGSESDVLDRCYKAAKTFSLDPIVRITSDDPIKDPEIIDHAISLFLENNSKYDLVCNTEKPTFPEGLDVEVIKFDSLQNVWRSAKTSFDREHLTNYFFENKKSFKIFNFIHDENLSHIRLTLDTQEDLILIKTIFSHLYQKNKNFSWHDVILLLKANPEFLKINKDIKKSGRYFTE